LETGDRREKLSVQLKRQPSILRAAAVAGILSALLTLAGSSPALAGGIVTQAVTPGVLSASIADLTLGSVVFSYSAQSTTGSMTLSADDSSGAAAGWKVSLQSSAFVYTGSYGGTDILPANFAITSVAIPVLVSGQAVNNLTGPRIPPTSPVGTLDSARQVITSNAAYGQGSYTEAIGVSLGIPAGSKVGIYTGTLTVTISASP
jgi:hypothetical protein